MAPDEQPRRRPEVELRDQIWRALKNGSDWLFDTMLRTMRWRIDGGFP
jgi:hypothetical protein